MAPKKGISALITVVLLIVFTVAISTLIVSWMFDYTKATTDAATESATGEKGITYCANSIVEISNVNLKNTVVAANNSVVSGTVNYFNLTSIAGTPTITFTGRSSSSGINGLAGWWHFDGNALDSSGNGNTGTVTGAAYNASGKFNAALQFDGDDYVAVADDAALDMTDAITLSAWVSPSSGGVYSEWAYKTPIYIQDARDAWWNSSWTKRKAIIVNTTTDLTDYQFNYTVSWVSGMNDTFKDLRFTYFNDTTGTQTELPYWVEQNFSQDNASVWVKANLTTGNNTVYMYYGKSGAGTESNGTATFDFYDSADDFADWSRDDEVDYKTLGFTIGNSDSYVLSTLFEDFGSGYGQFTYHGAHDFGIMADTTPNVYSMIGQDYGGGHNPGGIQYGLNSDYIDMTNTGAPLTNVLYKYTIMKNASEWNYKTINLFDRSIFFEGSKSGNLGDVSYIGWNGISGRMEIRENTTGTFGNCMRFKVKYSSSSNVVDVCYYDVFVRKYTTTEPTVLETSAEDTYLTDYQIKIDSINTSELYDFGKIQKYCNDTRFTWLNQTTGVEEAIDFWTENCSTTSGNSTFWVEVPEIYAGAADNTVYMYYGNAGAGTDSNGTETFEFFDDFEDGDYTINPAWTTILNSHGGTVDIVDNAPQVKAMHLYRTDGTYGIGKKTASSGTYSGWHARLKCSNGGDNNGIFFEFIMNGDTRKFRLKVASGGVVLSGPSGQIGSIYAQATGSWHTYDITRTSDGFFTVYIDGISRITGTDTDATACTQIGIYSDSWAGVRDDYADDVRIRKYASTEPTILSIGAEIANGISKGNAYAINANATHAVARINNQTITATISAGWNHIALTYNRSAGGTDEMKLYVNSVESVTADYSTAINTNDDAFVVGNSFTGTIDEVRVYNTALSQAEIANTYNTADLDADTTNPRVSFNGNPTVNYSGTLSNGATATITVDAGNFTVGENTITIYIDSGAVDYSVKMLLLSALVSNTGMNNVTVKQVVAFKKDGTYCVLKNDSTTFDVGGMFAVSGCGMGCLEFLALKAYTDCTGVSAEFTGSPSGC